MKASLPMYNEVEQPVEPIDDHKLAVAEEEPAKIEPPKTSYYLVNAVTPLKAVLIALAILAVWAVAEFLIV